MAPMSFFERVKRSLKNPNIKQFKELAALKEGRSLIATAVSLNCTADLLRLLIKEKCGDIDGKCDFTPRTSERRTYNALSIAVQLHRSDLVEILLQAGANYKTKFELIFVFAIERLYGTLQDQLKMLKTFLRHDPLQINWIDSYNITPLFAALSYSNDGCSNPKNKYTIVKYLIENGADFLTPNIWGETPLQFCHEKLTYEYTTEHTKSMYNPIFSLLKKKTMLHLLHKGRMLYDAHFINEHIYEHDRTSIDHLPTTIKNRIDNLPRVLYPTEGLSAVPGGKVEITDSKILATQEILHQVWSMKNQDVFRDLLEYI